MNDQFVIGIVGAPFGLDGSVKIKSLSGETAHLLRLTKAVLRHEGAEKILDVAESSAPSASAQNQPVVFMRFAGYSSPEEAKALSGFELIAGREDAAPLQPGEFYVEDLKGLAVIAGGAGIGAIAAIIEGGGGDLAEIQMHSGEKKLVPFRKEFFPVIDMEKRQAVLDNAWVLE